MPTDFTLPELGENITAGDVVRVLVALGDTSRRTRRSSSSKPTRRRSKCHRASPGTVKEVRVKQGERIKVGQVVLTVDDGGAGAAAKADGAKSSGTPRRATDKAAGRNRRARQPKAA